MFIFNVVFSQKYETKIYHPLIKTINCSKTSQSFFDYPAIKLNSNEKLTITFDIVDTNRFEDLDYDLPPLKIFYEIRHCDKDWNLSKLNEFDYLEGPIEDIPDSIFHSFRSFFQYNRIKITIPSPYVSFKLSGNYVLLVYYRDVFDRNIDNIELLFSFRFCVYEDIVSIKPTVTKPIYNDIAQTHQQVNFTASLNTFNTDIINNLTFLVLQNNFWPTQRIVKTPSAINFNQLVFENLRELAFAGGNEFRTLDIYNIFVPGQNISSFYRNDTAIYAFTNLQYERRYYQYNNDLNGLFYIKCYQCKKHNLEADYLYVTFLFKHNNPHAKIYLFGQLTEGNIDEKYRLKYDPNKKLFYLKMLLKQGYYSFTFATENDIFGYEGNFYETNNNYTFYAYYYDTNYGTDRLIGYAEYKAKDL